MPQARLRLTIPEHVWVGDVTRRYPDGTIKILAALSDEQSGTGLAEITAEDPLALVRDMDDDEEVTDIDVLKHSDGEVLVQFETTMPLLLLPARDSGVPLEMPFVIQDGTALWDVTAPNDRLSELGEQLEEFDISFTVEYVQERLTEEDLVTDRQRRVVLTAIENGYYDTPRTCSLTELAEELDIAKSTASETLHRAEEQIVKQYASQFHTSREAGEGDGAQKPKTGTNRKVR